VARPALAVTVADASATSRTPSGAVPTVSVVVPAHDAARTLGETLDSLLAQTASDWEAIVVDDGSTDATAAIAAEYARRDPRVRVVSQARAGEGGARNAGIAIARGAWLLFLDADDWIAPMAVERFTAATGPDVDAVVAGWVRVTADGTEMRDPFRPDTTDLFPTLARFCPFAIHACLVRRSCVDRVGGGGFERGMIVGADWDFWQRVARAGARFVAVDDVLAYYRVRPGSAAVNVPRLLEAGRRLITLGHAPDPRVASPVARHAAGMPRSGLPGALLHFACWPAGMVIGGGGDARHVLDPFRDAREREMDAGAVAHSLFLAALLPESRPPSYWTTLWPAARASVTAFLEELEEVSGTRELARRAARALEHLVLLHADVAEPLVVGTTLVVPLELTASIVDVETVAAVERLVCAVRLEGDAIGTLELPVCDGHVPAGVLADAAADQFGWTVLGRFFGHTIFPALDVRGGRAGSEVWRGGTRLHDGLPSDLPADRVERTAALHAAVGWPVFLQELWGEPSRATPWFYDAQADDRKRAAAPAADDPPAVEASAPIEDVAASGREATAELRIGGAPVALVSVPTHRGVASAHAILARCTHVAGLELFRVAVREGLLGSSLRDPTPLRERLAGAARRAPTRSAALASGAGAGTLVLGRRPGPVGTAVSRRAALPAACADVLRDAAATAGEGVLDAAAAPPTRIAYAPEALHLGAARATGVSTRGRAGARDAGRGDASPATHATAGFDRHYFETVFAAERDPWSYATPFEQLKYEQTMALLLDGDRPRRVLELACAEGMFTEQLAPRVDEVMATDIAQIAVDRTAARCAALSNVHVGRLDFARDPIPRGFDAIVCSEVLYYIGGRKPLSAVARKLAAALPRGGRIVTAHCNVVVDDPTAPGLDWDVPIGAKGIGEVFGATPGLRFVKELRTPLYRVQLFERVDGVRAAIDRVLPARGRARPERVDEARWVMPAPHVAARFRMNGGQPRTGGLPEATTSALPILMYHSVAPGGAPDFARYRVTPAAFEEQLRYLHEAGFRSVTLDEWRAAREKWAPLPMRAVMLTFDDGFRDFAEHAWPLLRRYGFGALVFLVTDHVGRTNAWDAAYGDPAPLLDWETVRRLRADGVEFGAHTATHRFLTACTPAEVVDEAARARATLCRELGEPPTAFAYPHGAEDPAVQHLVGATGYVYGLSCRPGRSRMTDPLLALSRIEVRGTDTLPEFIAKIGT
jgi:peptidoglycan/xylan/chitin deacetylase (PgdA/CDA1 family)/GT2 family glycosyltransferase/predicted TPR repeat methyltransferase